MTENSRGRPWAAWAVVAVWTVCFCLDLYLDVSGTLAGQGIHALNGQYYRLFSGLLLHSGFLHLAVNCMAMYWACQVLMPILGSGKLLLFALAAGCGAQAAFLLLLMSYFMQQRANQEAMDKLEQTSDSATQSLENILQSPVHPWFCRLQPCPPALTESMRQEAL